MALTNAHKLALRDWLQANIHKAVKTRWYREGIKDGNGKPVYGTCPKLDENGDPLLDEDDNPVTYYGRTFTVRKVQSFDWQEVVRRVWNKAQKNDYSVTPEQVATFLLQYRNNIKSWAGTNDVCAGIAKPDHEIDAEDPDANLQA